MRDLIKLQYVNHINERVDIGSGGIYAGSSDLRDYTWSMEQRGNKISRLYRDVATKTLPVIITAPTRDEAYQIRNRLFEVVEKDVLSMQPGKLICGKSYYQCYVTESKKPNYWKSPLNLVVELTLTTDRPVWVTESQYSFSPQGSNDGYLDFPFDFPFDFKSSAMINTLSNPGFVATDFRMDIFGACTNPQITINGHLYAVEAEVETGEYLAIDSAKKTIVKTAQNGEKTNLFNSRNKESYVFEKIQPGVNSVTWDGSFNFSVTILEERSEPKWT